MVVNDEPWSTGTASPGDGTALGLGRLVADGLLEAMTDLTSVSARTLDSGATRIDARIAEHRHAASRDLRAHQATTGCGLRHYVHCAPGLLARPRLDEVPVESGIATMLNSLFEACRHAAPGGGVHAAGLWHDGELRFVTVDVARHAALEKVVGSACRIIGLPVRGGLVTTARISGAMALLAARAGVSWVASRSIPTTLAVDIAAVARLTLVARAAGGSARFMTPPTLTLRQ